MLPHGSHNEEGPISTPMPRCNAPGHHLDIADAGGSDMTCSMSFKPVKIGAWRLSGVLVRRTRSWSAPPSNSMTGVHLRGVRAKRNPCPEGELAIDAEISVSRTNLCWIASATRREIVVIPRVAKVEYLHRDSRSIWYPDQFFIVAPELPTSDVVWCCTLNI